MELTICRYLDSSPRVKAYFYEALKLPYVVNCHGKVFRRNYLPDFVIQFDDNVKELWEVKPLKETSNPINIAKFRSAAAFCSKYNIKFRIVTESIVAGLLRSLK